MIASTYKTDHIVSNDGGKTYSKKPVEEEIIFGAFFFLGNIRTEHTRKLYNILNLLTEIGGIQATMFAFIKMIGTYFNTQIFMSKMMSEMQYAKLAPKDKQDQELMRKVSPLNNGLFQMRY